MAARDIKVAFEPEGITLPLTQILPLRKVSPGLKNSEKYKRIQTSIAEVGVVEPLVVYPQKSRGGHGQFFLLDGHMRYEALKELGRKETFCLISTEDEGYTYNHHVNRLSPIQEHMMIMKAIKCGVEEERIARTLAIDTAKIREKRQLIKGICEEAVDLLKAKNITPNALRQLKGVMPLRQMEMAEMMVAANNYTKNYARALFLATSQDMLVEKGKQKSAAGMRPEDISRMEKEMGGIQRDFRVVEETYAQNMLKLVLAHGYVGKLLDNVRVVRFLSKNYPDFLSKFQQILEATGLEG